MRIPIITLCCVLTLLTPACGGGGGGSSEPATPSKPRVILVNSAAEISIQSVLIEAFELGNIINEYSSLEQDISLPTGSAVVLDQDKADALLDAIPGPAGMDSFVFFATPMNPSSFAGQDLAWSPGEGDYIFELFPDPDFPATSDDEFTVRRLSVDEYESLIASGSVSLASGALR